MVISDIDMPFSELVGFMVKVAIAAVPAAIIIAIVYVVGIALLSGIGMRLF